MLLFGPQSDLRKFILHKQSFFVWFHKVFKPPCVKKILTEKDTTDIIGTLSGASNSFNDIWYGKWGECFFAHGGKFLPQFDFYSL